MARTGFIPKGSAAARQNENNILNGSFVIRQRGASDSFVNSGSGGLLVRSLDRWNFWVGAAMASTVSRIVTPINGIGSAMRVQRNAGVTTTTNIQMTQLLQSHISRKLAGKQVTVSFFARNGANASHTSFFVELITGTSDAEVNPITTGFTGSATLVSDNLVFTTTSQKYSVTFTVPAGTQQMALNFRTIGYSGTAGANDWYELEQVMVNEGDFAAPFRMLGDDVAAELAFCQRYYQAGRVRNLGYALVGGFIGTRATFLQTMRIAPTILQTNEFNSGSMSSTTQNAEINREGFLSFRTATGSANHEYAETWTAEAEV